MFLTQIYLLLTFYLISFIIYSVCMLFVLFNEPFEGKLCRFRLLGFVCKLKLEIHLLPNSILFWIILAWSCCVLGTPFLSWELNKEVGGWVWTVSISPIKWPFSLHRNIMIFCIIVQYVYTIVCYCLQAWFLEVPLKLFSLIPSLG